MANSKFVKTLIIEDDPSSVKLLKEFLKDISFIEVAGEAGSIKDAEKLIAAHQDADLIFLDIDLNGVNSLDLLKNTKSRTKVLFITAYADFAVRAFEYNTVDYLVKPVSFDRLKKALARISVIDPESVPAESRANSGRFAMNNMILMNIDNEMKFIKISDINYIEAKGNYTDVHLADGSSFTTYGLIKVWEDKLPLDDFFRIHRSTIVSLHNVAKIERGAYDTGILYLRNIDKPFEVSRNYFSQIKGKFKLTSNL
jgi:two-component system LytT family response regulator